MKTIIKSFVLGFITLIGCSCSYTESDEPVTTNYVVGSEVTEVNASLSEVVQSMKGHYIGRFDKTKDFVTITDAEIVIETESLNYTIDLTQETPIEAKLNCLLRFYMPDGSVISILLGWYAETPENRNLLFITVNGVYISDLERVDSI